MSKKKKILYGIISTITAVSVIVAIVALALSKDNSPALSDDGYEKTIVYLGDSISEGLLGPSPVAERDSSAYFALVGRSNNFRYIESAVSGDDTAKLYGRITGESTASKERRYWLSQADIIHISILGNDFLVGDIGKNAYDYLDGNPEAINAQLTRAREYFGKSLSKVKEINPNAVLLVNTLYNPLDAASTLISQSRKDAIVEISDNNPAAVRAVGELLISKLNEIVFDYLEENPGAYEIIDVYTKFDEIYKENYTDGISLFYRDWMHPSNEGHAVIASLIQEKLEALGLANKDFALSRYKNLRLEQADRLFTGTSVDNAALKASISAAKSHAEVSNLYSKAVRRVVPVYSRDGFSPLDYTRPQGETFSETKTFKVTSFRYEDGSDLISFMNDEVTAFTFNPDGSFTLNAAPMQGLIAMANKTILADALKGGLDLNDMLGEDNFESSVFGAYLLEVFPGFNLRYIKEVFSLFTSCGIYINGFDFDSDNIKLLVNSLEEDLTIPEGFVLPEISIELRGWYFINTTDEFTNIHMGLNNVSQDGFPLFFSTLHTPEDGAAWTETAVEVSKLIIKAEEIK